MSKKVRFISGKYPSLSLVLSSDKKIVINNNPTLQKGIRVKFSRNQFETDNPEVIRLMRTSNFFNNAIGFYEDKGPTAQEVMSAQKKLKEMTSKAYYCNLCSQGFENSNALLSHLKSKAHKDKERAKG